MASFFLFVCLLTALILSLRCLKQMMYISFTLMLLLTSFHFLSSFFHYFFNSSRHFYSIYDPDTFVSRAPSTSSIHYAPFLQVKLPFKGEIDESPRVPSHFPTALSDAPTSSGTPIMLSPSKTKKAKKKRSKSKKTEEKKKSPSAKSKTSQLKEHTARECDDHWIIKSLLKKMEPSNVIHKSGASQPYEELADYVINKQHVKFHSENITSLYQSLNRTLVIVDHRVWLYKHFLEYLSLPSYVRVVIIGNIYGSNGKFGDFSVRVGFRPKVFAKWNQWGGATLEEFKAAFDDDRIVGVFVSQHTLIEHEKLISIPLGHNVKRERLGALWKKVSQYIDSGAQPWRGEVIDHFGDMFNARVRILDYLNSTDDFRGKFGYRSKRKQVTSDLLDLKFQLSMPGNGMDSWKHIESFIFGVIPVMLTSTMDRSWAKLPVLLLDSYKDLTMELLQETYADICSHQDDYELERIGYEYWKGLITNVRDYGTKILNARHPLKFKSGKRFYNQDKDEMKALWKYIANDV